jgi:hypothetical protein
MLVMLLTLHFTFITPVLGRAAPPLLSALFVFTNSDQLLPGLTDVPI